MREEHGQRAREPEESTVCLVRHSSGEAGARRSPIGRKRRLAADPHLAETLRPRGKLTKSLTANGERTRRRCKTPAVPPVRRTRTEPTNLGIAAHGSSRYIWFAPCRTPCPSRGEPPRLRQCRRAPSSGPSARRDERPGPTSGGHIRGRSSDLPHLLLTLMMRRYSDDRLIWINTGCGVANLSHLPPYARRQASSPLPFLAYVIRLP